MLFTAIDIKQQGSFGTIFNVDIHYVKVGTDPTLKPQLGSHYHFSACSHPEVAMTHFSVWLTEKDKWLSNYREN